MLVLARKKEEKIHVGPNITITIVQIKGGTVKIGIEAPAEVSVLRAELVGREPSRNGKRRPAARAATVPTDRESTPAEECAGTSDPPSDPAAPRRRTSVVRHKRRGVESALAACS